MTSPPSPKKIVFIYPMNGATYRWVHTGHHQDLLFEHMLDALKKDQAEDLAEIGEGDLAWKEMLEAYSEWPIDELMKYGVLSLYHLWERHAKSLCIEQLGSLPSYGRVDVVTGVLGILEHQLLAPTEPQYREALHECRRLANAIKHDVTDGFDKLEKDYPDHFTPGSNPAEDRFRIKADSLRRLFKSVQDFWEALPHEVDHTAVFQTLAGKAKS